MVVLRLRIAVIGEPTSGKTAFVQMVHTNGSSYPKNYLMTMGCDFVVKEVTLDEETTVELSLFDVAGQKLYDTMTQTYLDHVSAFILVYDISNKTTFETCKRWVTKARNSKKDMMGFLIANKMDLADKAEVTDSQGEIFAKANQLKFFKCSALRGTGINEPIEDLARMFADGYKKRVDEVVTQRAKHAVGSLEWFNCTDVPTSPFLFFFFKEKSEVMDAFVDLLRRDVSQRLPLWTTTVADAMSTTYIKSVLKNSDSSVQCKCVLPVPALLDSMVTAEVIEFSHTIGQEISKELTSNEVLANVEVLLAFMDLMRHEFSIKYTYLTVISHACYDSRETIRSIFSSSLFIPLIGKGWRNASSYCVMLHLITALYNSTRISIYQLPKMEDDPTWTLNCQTLSRSLQSLQKKISIIRRSTKKIVNVADINKARGKIRDTTRSANVEDVSSIQESLRIIERFMEVRPTYTMEGVQLMGDAQQALRDFQQACDMFYKTCIEVEESSRGSRAPFGLLPEEYEEDAEEEPTESQHLLSKGPSQRARYEQELHNEIMAELERETHEIAENVRDVHIIFNHIAKLMAISKAQPGLHTAATNNFAAQMNIIILLRTISMLSYFSSYLWCLFHFTCWPNNRDRHTFFTINECRVLLYNNNTNIISAYVLSCLVSLTFYFHQAFSKDCRLPSSVCPMAEEHVVTPWTVEGDVDYDKLIKEFGSHHIDHALLERMERIIKKPVHHFLRRGIFFSHRDLATVLDLYEQGKPFYLYTGRGPSSESMHTGHLVPFLFTKWLQDTFQVPLVIQLTDDEKFFFKDLTIDQVEKMTDFDYVGSMYRVICRIERAYTANQVRGCFGFKLEDNCGKWMFPAIQAAPSFSAAFPHIFPEKQGNVFCLIPHAIDQDPYFRLTRDIAPRLGYLKPAAIHSKFFPGLSGSKGKMSSSVGAAVFLTDTPKMLKDKINKHAFSGGGATKEEQLIVGANTMVDIPMQWLRFFLDDDEKLRQIEHDYMLGRMMSGEVKKVLIECLSKTIKDHQESRKNVSDDTVRLFMSTRLMGPAAALQEKEHNSNA
eukprot:gene914-541_t